MTDTATSDQKKTSPKNDNSQQVADTDTTNAAPPLALKGSLFTLTVLQLADAEPEQFSEHVAATVQQSPKFFENAPLVIDVQDFSNPKSLLKLTKVLDILRQHQIIPIGIRGGSDAQQKQALELGLALFPSTKSPQQELDLHAQTEKNSSAKKAKTAKTMHAQPAKQNKLVTQPVRSGQQIYAKGGDLIITAAVSHGAEILADGNIHVYGPLRGRALAGVNGDVQARIFCQGMEAELIAIAGHYLVRENAPTIDKNSFIQIYLDKDERLQMTPVVAA